jgi:hypothetical protein
MRQAGPENAVFASILCSLRNGSLSDEQLAILNTRVLSDPARGAGGVAHSDVPSSVTIVTPVNQEREYLNDAVIGSVCEHLMVVRLLCCCTSRSRPVSPALMRWLLNTATESTCGKLAPVLDLFVGMRVIVVQNVATVLGVANGTTATVRRICWPADAQLPLTVPLTVPINGIPRPINLATSMPDYIELRIDGIDRVLVDGFDPGCFPHKLFRRARLWQADKPLRRRSVQEMRHAQAVSNRTGLCLDRPQDSRPNAYRWHSYRLIYRPATSACAMALRSALSRDLSLWPVSCRTIDAKDCRSLPPKCRLQSP